MNEKIKELMLEATKDMPETYYWPGQYVEKFAELIVGECCQVVADIPIDALEPDYKILADHFGIDFERDWS